MSQSIKDEPTISAREFSILKDIVKRLPDRDARASLETATLCYEETLQARGIDIKSDKVYFSALLRLNHYEGLTWREKLLNAASRVETEFKSQAEPRRTAHRRYRSDASSHNIPSRQENGIQIPVIQQKLHHSARLLRQSQPPRLDFQTLRAVKEEEVPSLTGETTYALIQKFKLFQRTQSRKKLHYVLLYWLEATHVVQEIRREQLEYAIDEDHHTLKLQAFEIWLKIYQASVEARQIQARKAQLNILRKCYRRWENLIIKRRQEQYIAKMAAEKEALFRALMKKNQKKLLSGKLKCWRKKLRIVKQRIRKALILRDKRTQVVVWKTWFFKTCELRTAQCYLKAIETRAFRLWLARIRRIAILTQRALAKRNEDLSTSAWDNWRLNFSAREEAREVAVRYRSSHLLRSSLSVWCHAFKLARRYDQTQIIVEDRLLRDSLKSWTEALKHKLKLSEAAEVKRGRSLIRTWRRETKASVFRRLLDQDILKVSFKTWRVESRGRTLHSSLESRTVASVFRHWRSKCSNVQNRLQVAEDEVIALGDDRRLTKSVAHWLRRLDLGHLKYSMAEQRYDRTVLSFAFAKYRLVFDERCFQRKRAETFEIKVSNKQVYRAWQVALAQRKEKDRNNKLYTIVTRQETAILASSFARWSRRAMYYTRVGGEAELMNNTRDRSQLHYFFTAWCDRHLDIFEMERVARDLECQNGATFMLQSLVEKHRSRLETLNLADQIWNEKVQEFAGQQMARWQARYRKSEEKGRHADFLWNDTFCKRSLRNILRKWLVKRRDRVRSRGGETSPGDLSSSRSGSFDASRTRIPWNESRSFRLNRSVLH